MLSVCYVLLYQWETEPVGRSAMSSLVGRVKNAPSLDLRAYRRQGIAYEESNNGYHPDNIDHDITCGTRAVTG